jgi:hypothetical protein
MACRRSRFYLSLSGETRKPSRARGGFRSMDAAAVIDEEASYAAAVVQAKTRKECSR